MSGVPPPPSPPRTLAHVLRPDRALVRRPGLALVPRLTHAVVPPPARAIVLRLTQAVVPRPARAIVPRPTRKLVPRPARAITCLAAVALVAASALAAPPADARAARWVAPVEGDVVAAFRYDRGSPFAAGQRRGVAFASRPGEVVVAPCSGPVAFAGRVPGRGRVVALICGGLRATVLRLGATAARRGDRVRRGTRVGTAGETRVDLGARRVGDRFGYVDPLGLVGAIAPPELGPAPPPRREPPPRLPAPEAPAPAVRRAPVPSAPLPAAPAPAVRRAPTASPAPARAPYPVPSPAPALPSPAPALSPATPALAWLGLALVGAAAPAGALWRRRRRRARGGSAQAAAGVASGGAR